MNDQQDVAGDSFELRHNSVRHTQLGIRHLMLWIFVTASFLGLARQQLDQSWDSWISVAAMFINITGCVVIGAAIMGTLVLTWDRFRWKCPMLRRPGHWIVIGTAGFWLAFLLFAQLGNLLELMIPAWSATTGAIFAVSVADGIFYLIAAHRTPQLRWKALFVVLAVQQIVHVIPFAAMMTGQYDSKSLWSLSVAVELARFAFPAYLIIVLIRDRIDSRGKIENDWLHWLGVCILLANCLMGLFWYVAIFVDQKFWPLQ